MRLLEFENVNNGNIPHAAAQTGKPAKKTASTISMSPHHDEAKNPPLPVFRINGKHAVKKPRSRQPIDIEQLQQRVDVLERRIRERARANGRQLPVRELEQLKQRLKLLERSVHNELWAAKQREHTLLELLARPPVKQLIRMHVKRLHAGTLRATRRWWATLGQLNQPTWWPHFARAWQESLDKARGNHNT
jgi:hypothetical protein